MRVERLFSGKVLLGIGVAAVSATVLLSGCKRGFEVGPLPELQVAAVFNDEQIQIRYRYENDEPSWYHQVLRYEDGRWVRYGSGEPGEDPYRLYEDRISMMLDDGSVEGFDRFGGFMTVHQGMRSLADPIPAEQVRAHSWLGETLGRSDVRKFLPQSRDVQDPSEVNWDKVKGEAELAQMRADGVFLDLWQWRAHRSNPLGYADNGYVLEYRHSSDGQGMFVTNWDAQSETPRWMFDPEQVGHHALDWARLTARGYSQDDAYFLAESNAVPFDPNHQWQEGDVIPQRFLRSPEGSRGAIKADGRWQDGAWEVTLTRSLEAPNPLDSKTLRPGEVYNVSFAVHEASGARWHKVSLPLTLGLEANADIVARRVDGPLDGVELDWHTVRLISTNAHVDWQWLHSDHGGARRLADENEQTTVVEEHGPAGVERRLRLMDRRMDL